MQGRERLWWWAAVGGLALAGLALRIAAAHGGLWTDEAWSVIYAAQARDPIGVFLRINHDNNHHLYSLWLQAIGPAAAPLLARAPAIAAGTLCIIVAALLAGGDRQLFANSRYGDRSAGSYRSFWWIGHDPQPSIAALGVFGQRLYIEPKAQLALIRVGSHPVASNLYTDAIHRNAITALRACLIA